ncbi:MAG: cation-transporting P-type ATPase [Rectinemataceae bacterium]
MQRMEAPWSADRATLIRAYKTDENKGLAAFEAGKRLKEYGENKIKQFRRLTFFDILKEEVKEPMIILLLAIGLIYGIWGKIGDTVTIVLVVMAVSLVEVFTEYKAKKSIEALKELAQPTTWVVRDGKPLEVSTGLLVPGDILILKSGVRIGADARVLISHGLEADESQLTGESMGIPKIADPIAVDSGLSDRNNMLHMGSVILRGKGAAIVIATGMDTELGKIAGLTQEAGEPKTPLQKSMKELSKNLVWIAVAFSVLIPVIGLLQGKPLKEMILTGLSLSFATIPEEMPILVTMLLGLGSINLSRKNVLIRRTKAAETLGSVTVIATDKTGTLTENKMRIASWAGADEKLLFSMGSLMADIEFDGAGGFLGDPMDSAVLVRAKELGIDRTELRAAFVPVNESGFDETKRIFESTFLHDGRRISVIKGAPESVFAMSAPNAAMEKSLETAMSTGYRTIAVARKDEAESVYGNVGIISFDDPIREGVKDAIAECSGAGVRVIMITGDHADTARRVAANAGIGLSGVITGAELDKLSGDALKSAVRHCNVFARISPEQKLKIVGALRENGEVVAVTGDGINDAPALKAADIGIAMGVSGTDVAKEAADMILTDDSFTSIVGAIREGRRLYDNLSKCVKYYLACKVGLILSFLVPVLINLPMPFSPVQIIILEIFMDLAASTSFVAEPAEIDLLKRKPRKSGEPGGNFMNRSMMTGIFSGGITLAVLVLGVNFYSWFTTGDLAIARTWAFASWLFGHVGLALNMRTSKVPLTKIGVFSSRPFNVWMIAIVVFIGLAISVPGIGQYLNLAPIGIGTLMVIALIAVLATSWMEIRKHFAKNPA